MHLHTASPHTSARIPGLPRDEAARLRDRLTSLGKRRRPGCDRGAEPGAGYRRLSPLTPLVRSFIFLVAVVGSSWQSALHGELGPIGWLLLALALAGLVYGAASWVRTKYWIEADELRVDTGVVARQSRRIRIDRLQGIDIVQPFVARLFGLAELSMDVAGSGREGSLSFLKLSEAQQLKELLLARRDLVRVEPAQPERPEAPERLLTKVGPGLLAASIALSSETVMSLLGAALLIGLAVWFDSLAAVGGLFPVLIGAGLVAFRRFSGAYGFTVTEGPAGLQVRRGLSTWTRRPSRCPACRASRSPSRCCGAGSAGRASTCPWPAAAAATTGTDRPPPRCCRWVGGRSSTGWPPT